MARLETGEALIERTQLDLAELARTTVDQMQLLAEQKKLQPQFRAAAPVNSSAAQECVTSWDKNAAERT